MSVTLKNSVPDPQKPHRVSIKNTAQLMLLREIITVYSQNHTRQAYMNMLYGYYAAFLKLKYVVHTVTVALITFYRRKNMPSVILHRYPP
jgi:hypothetical protein